MFRYYTIQRSEAFVTGTNSQGKYAVRHNRLISKNPFKRYSVMHTQKSNTHHLDNPTDLNKLEDIFKNILTPIVEKHAEKLDEIIKNNKLDSQEEV